MKNEHKKKLNEALNKIAEAKVTIERIRDAEQEAHDNVAETQNRTQEIIDALDSACSNLDDVNTQITESLE